jgi:hypothetical protein
MTPNNDRLVRQPERLGLRRLILLPLALIGFVLLLAGLKIAEALRRWNEQGPS